MIQPQGRSLAESAGAYDPVLRRVGARLVSLAARDQEDLDAIILQSNGGGRLTGMRARLVRIVERYNPQVVFLACTELSLLLPMPRFHNVVDSLDALANATFKVSAGLAEPSTYVSS